MPCDSSYTEFRSARIRYFKNTLELSVGVAILGSLQRIAKVSQKASGLLPPTDYFDVTSRTPEMWTATSAFPPASPTANQLPGPGSSPHMLSHHPPPLPPCGLCTSLTDDNCLLTHSCSDLFLNAGVGRPFSGSQPLAGPTSLGLDYCNVTGDKGT